MLVLLRIQDQLTLYRLALHHAWELARGAGCGTVDLQRNPWTALFVFQVVRVRDALCWSPSGGFGVRR